MNDNAALLIIDVQKGFDAPQWGRRINAGAEAVMAGLLERWRADGRPVIHVQHLSRNPKSPLRPGQPGVEFKEQVRPLPGEAVVQKHVNSAFIGTDLEARLRREGIGSLVIVGIAVDHCVSTTARMAANLGFDTTVVADATVAFDRAGYDGTVHPAETVHAVTLASLHGEFARVVSSAELLRTIGTRPAPASR